MHFKPHILQFSDDRNRVPLPPCLLGLVTLRAKPRPVGNAPGHLSQARSWTDVEPDLERGQHRREASKAVCQEPKAVIAPSTIKYISLLST